MTTTKLSHTSQTHRSRSKPHSRGHSSTGSSTAKARSRKRAISRSRSEKADFYCMRCKDHSTSPVDHYDTDTWGNRQVTMAKGHCKKCKGKMSLIVPQAASVSHRSRSHSKSGNSGKRKRSLSHASPSHSHAHAHTHRSRPKSRQSK